MESFSNSSLCSPMIVSTKICCAMFRSEVPCPWISFSYTDRVVKVKSLEESQSSAVVVMRVAGEAAGFEEAVPSAKRVGAEDEAILS